MVIGELTLWEKMGGRSGTYRRTAPFPRSSSSLDDVLDDDDDFRP